MACEGGCITGPSTHSGSNNGKRQLVQELAKQKKHIKGMHEATD